MSVLAPGPLGTAASLVLAGGVPGRWLLAFIISPLTLDLIIVPSGCTQTRPLTFPLGLGVDFFPAV